MGWGEPLGRDRSQDRAAEKVIEAARQWRKLRSTGSEERLCLAIDEYDAAEKAADASPVRAGWRRLHEPEAGRRSGW